jgi:hypothetical protein
MARCKRSANLILAVRAAKFTKPENQYLHFLGYKACRYMQFAWKTGIKTEGLSTVFAFEMNVVVVVLVASAVVRTSPVPRLAALIGDPVDYALVDKGFERPVYRDPVVLIVESFLEETVTDGKVVFEKSFQYIVPA